MRLPPRSTLTDTLFPYTTLFRSQSGMLYHQPYGFNTRFEDQPGTNPEELIAAAHASCFTMALAFALERAGYVDGTLETWAAVVLDRDRDGFAITRSDLEPYGRASCRERRCKYWLSTVAAGKIKK